MHATRWILAWALAATATSRIAAGDLLVSSRFNSHVLRFDAATGRFVGVFASGYGMANPNGIAYGPDGNLYVGNGDQPRVLKLDGQTGEFLGNFVTTATRGGLANCRAIAFGPDGNLYVDSGANDVVLAYDGRTGAFLRVAAQGNGMDGPVGLTFGPDGNLYVGAALSNAVYVFDPAGTFLRSFNCSFNESNATGVLFDPEGHLFVAQSVTNKVLAFDAESGACERIVAEGGGLSIPIGMILAPDGNLLVGSFGTNSVLKFDLETGEWLGAFIPSGSGGLHGTHNFAYVPDLSCGQIPPGAVAWWPGDGTAHDLLGTHDGALRNGAAFAPGKDQDGFLFDGVDDAVEVPDAPALDPVGSFSLELWMRATTPGGPDAALLEKGALYRLAVAQGHAVFAVGEVVVEGRASVGDGQWHHLVAARDVEAGTLTLFVDGALDVRAPWSGAAEKDGEASPFILGGGAFAGQLDEVALYARALSACEVSALFGVGHGLKCKGDGDGDGVADYADNCPTDPNPAQADLDGDGRGDLCDCAPADPGTLAAPGELGGLEVGLGSDKARLDWCARGARYGGETSYDVARGDLAQLASGGACLTSTALPLASDPTLPAPGKGFWYLARARNACGSGTFGFRRDGQERLLATPCP